MDAFLGYPATLTITNHIVIPTFANSDYSVRVFGVNFGSTTTNTYMVLSDKPFGASTATALTTSVLVRVHDNYTGTGAWDSHYGVRFRSGCFVQTSASFTFCSIVYALENL